MTVLCRYSFCCFFSFFFKLLSLTQQRLNIQNQAENQDHYAESVWNMVTELGLTTGTSKRNYVQMLEEMEERDGEEAASLGIKRWTP